MSTPSPLGAVLLTGAPSPLGRAVALALAPHCHLLVLHYHRRGGEAEDLARECVTAGAPRVEVRGADLTDVSQVDGLAADVLGLGPSLSLLVHNAGLYHRAPLGQVEAGELDRLWAVNVRAPLLLTQALLPALRAARGQALFLADVGGLVPWRHHAAYGATKAAVAWLVRSLALELAPDVRVNGVAPGLITPPEGLDPEARASLVRRIPMGRAGEPAEIADAARWFALGAGYVTGQVLAVDGGRSAGRAD